MTEAGWTVCIECGMMCEAVEYHPYAACLMFKQCLNSETVRANLQAVRDDSYHQGRVAGLRECKHGLDIALDEGPLKAALYRWIDARAERLEREAQGAQDEKGGRDGK